MPRENKEESSGIRSESELMRDFLETPELIELRQKIDRAVAEIETDIEKTQKPEYKNNPAVARIGTELNSILDHLKRAKNLAGRGEKKSFVVFGDYNEIYQEKRKELAEAAAKNMPEKEQSAGGQSEEPQFSPEFQEILAEKEKMLEQIRGIIQKVETDLKTINDAPELSADPVMGNKIRFALEGLLANLNALRSNVEDSHTKGSFSGNAETLTSLSREHNELRKQYQEEYDRIEGIAPEQLPEITAEKIKSIAARVQEAFRDALDAGVSQAGAGAKAKEKLDELTQDNPELKRLANKEIEETARIAKDRQGPQNLPATETTPPVLEKPSEPKTEEQGYQEGLSQEEKTLLEQYFAKKSGESVESEEERNARVEREMIAKHLAERHERETASLPATERKLSEAKPPEETEGERHSELRSQVVNYWISDLIFLPQQEERVERMKAKVEELAGQNELLKEELLSLGLHLVTEDETTEPEPEPTPEEKKEIEEAEIVAAEAVAEAVEAAAEPEPAPPADAVDVPIELGVPPFPETAESPISTSELIKKELAGFNITPEQIAAEVPYFNDLSEGRQFLVLENLKQITLGRIQEETQQKYKISLGEANLAKRIWLGITREYQIARAEKSSAQEIIHGGIEKHKSILEQLTRGALVGPEAEISHEGKLDIHYLDLNRLGKETETPFSEEEKEKIIKFNRLALEYSRLPHEWSLSGNKQELKFYDKYLDFKSLRTEVIQILGTHLDTRYAYELMAETQRQIKLNQLLNSNPEAEKALQKIENQRAWAKFLGDSITERGVSFGLGFAARTFAVGTLGLIGLPIAAAGAAAINSWRRARKILAEEESAARRGAKTEKVAIRPEGSKGGEAGEKIIYEKSKLVTAERLSRHLNNLINKYQESTAEPEQEKILKQLVFFGDYAAERIESGTVNFGKSESRYGNQYDLLESIGLAKANVSSYYGETINRDVIVKILEKKQDQNQKERSKRIYSDIKRGALYAAGFSIAGMLARELSDHLGLTSPHEAAEIMEPKGKDAIRGGFSVSDFEKQIGVDSRDGLNENEAERVVGAAKKLKSIGNLKAAEEIERRYGGMVTQDTKKPIGEIFAEKEKVLPKVEEIPKPPQETTKTTPAETPAPPETAKTTLKPWENVIDSEKVGAGSDSVWKSTKEYFLYQRPEELKSMGFDVPRKLPSGESNPEFGPALDKWADKQTANLIEGWKQAHGGQSPDIVHNGDKVVIDFDTENKPHLKILNAEGQEIEPKSFAPTEPEPTDEEIREQEGKLQKQIAAEESSSAKATEGQGSEHIIHPITGEDLGADPHPELPETPAEIAPTPTPETPPAELSPAEEFKKSWEKAKTMGPFEGEEERARIVKNYVEKMTAGENYPEYGHKIWGETLDTFAHMFPMEGIAQTVDDIDTPQELAEAIAKFEKQLTDTTKLLLENSFRKLTPSDNPFPVVSAEGEHIYFAYPRGGNKWNLTKFDLYGIQQKTIPNPHKLFWARDKFEFNIKDIKKLLGY